MKIAVFGPGAGAHFISQRLVEEENVEQVYFVGANLAIQPTNKLVPLDIQLPEVLEFLDNTKIDLIVLLSINHLLNKRLQNKIKEKGIPSCSPTTDLAMLEWSKVQGKELLTKLEIPTPTSRKISRDDLIEEFLNIPRPWVLKFDKDWRAGLQTIIITDENVEKEFNDLKTYGDKRFLIYMGDFVNQQFSIEEFMIGKREYSYHTLCGEDSWVYLGSARDYKRFYEGDVGFNTAGMGSYSPVDINPKVHEYADKILSHLKSIGTPYTGILYLGIMEDVNGEPYVLEINARPGDPEILSILLTIDDTVSLSKILYQAATGQPIDPIVHNNKHSVSLRIVNSKYEESIKSTALQDWNSIEPHCNPHLWPEMPDMYINLNQIRRIINSVVTVSAETRHDASGKLYKFLHNLEMYNFRYRTDIGYLE